MVMNDRVGFCLWVWRSKSSEIPSVETPGGMEYRTSFVVVAVVGWLPAATIVVVVLIVDFCGLFCCEKKVIPVVIFWRARTLVLSFSYHRPVPHFFLKYKDVGRVVNKLVCIGDTRERDLRGDFVVLQLIARALEAEYIIKYWYSSFFV